MLKNLADTELEMATKLIFDGLSMAKASMEQILQSPISLKKIDYGEEKKLPSVGNETGEPLHVIKTNLIGDLRGTSHLIFSEKDVNNICAACLSKDILENDSPENKVMKVGFLTEIDNMVAGAVITEFANKLNLDIYGHVPSLHMVKPSEIEEYFINESNDYDSIIHFKAIFHGTELDISPDFVWIFPTELVEKIKQQF